MAYKRVTIMDISEIIRRRRDGQDITQISRALGFDRKTVRKYVTQVDANLVNTNNNERPGRPAKKQVLLEPYLDEIRCLVNDKVNPLKPKTAFEVICVRHGLSGKVSYTSFKRFVRAHRIAILPDRTTAVLKWRLQVNYRLIIAKQAYYMTLSLINDERSMPLSGRYHLAAIST